MPKCQNKDCDYSSDPWPRTPACPGCGWIQLKDGKGQPPNDINGIPGSIVATAKVLANRHGWEAKAKAGTFFGYPIHQWPESFIPMILGCFLHSDEDRRKSEQKHEAFMDHMKDLGHGT